MKELRKGNKAPYHGYLLGVNEYKAYVQLQRTMPLIKDFIQQDKKGGDPL